MDSGALAATDTHQDVPWSSAHTHLHADVIDTEATVVHRIDDLVEAGMWLGVLLVTLLLSIYAQATTLAVTSDVTSVVSSTLRQLSLVPVRILENFVTVLVPAITFAALAIQRRWRTLLHTVTTGVVGAVVATLVTITLHYASASGPFAALLVAWIPSVSIPTVAISVPLAAIAASLRAAGERASAAYLRSGWASLWFVLSLLVIQGRMTLVSAIVTVLIGAIVGSLGRYSFGTPSRRGSGAALIATLSSLGIHPEKVVRVDCEVGVDPICAQTLSVSRSASSGLYDTRLRSTAEALEVDFANEIARAQEAVGITATLPTYVQANRFYAVWDDAQRCFLVEATDSDRLLLSRLADWWSRLRLRGSEHSEPSTIRDAVEHTALVWQAAQAAGVRCPRFVGVGRAESSFLAAFEMPKSVTLLSHIDGALSDEAIADLWDQLGRAHDAGLTHRNIDASSVALDGNGHAFITHWDQGEVAASELSQRIDLVQMLVLTALLVGTERAVATATAALGEQRLSILLPVLQPIALPRSSRLSARRGKLLKPLRAEMERVCTVESREVDSVELRGFSVRTLIIAAVTVTALVVVFSTLNLRELIDVMSQATWWWLAVGFVMSLLNAPAQAMTLKGVCPEKLGWRESTAVQLAGSLTSLVAPTGLGVAALNLRYLAKHRVSTPLALATVSLMQAFQFVVTVILLIIFVGFTGTSISVNFFSGPLLVTVICLLAAVGVFFAIAPARAWAMKRLAGPLSQVWPRVVWVMGSPSRVLYASGGVIIMVVTQVAAFGCALAAFGRGLSPSTLAVTFLVSNTVGSLVPTPGGLGPVEASLTGGLQLAGIPAAIALSTALAYRLLTFWGRAPVGWLALKYLQRKNIL